MEEWLAGLGAQILTGAEDIQGFEALLVRVGIGDATAFLEACRLLGEAGEASAVLDALDGLADVTPATLVGATVMHAFAALRVIYPSRQDASAARSRLGALADSVYPEAGAVFGHEALDWLVRLVGTAVVELSAIAAARAPVVRVETGLSLPSSLLAFDLYGDPGRGVELAERNRCGTSFLMPVAFEALAD